VQLDLIQSPLPVYFTQPFNYPIDLCVVKEVGSAGAGRSISGSLVVAKNPIYRGFADVI
jgi:hypothetical protein